MKILCVGNSYSYYWTDELCGLLNAAGYKDVRVSNIYYSGCTFERHWNWYVNKEENYRFATVKDGVRTSVKPVGMDYCLDAEEDWDIISFQQSNRYKTQEMRDSIKAHLPQLYELFKTRFPTAKFHWQQNWAHEVRQCGEGKGMPSVEAQEARTDAFRTVAREVCEEYGFINVPLGDAWPAVRHEPMFYEKGDGDYPVRSMHTRVLNSKFESAPRVTNTDLSHDGDIGGGQYLNACVWFEMVTHKSVIGNPFRPEYVHELTGNVYRFTEEKIAVLQNAAHNAVMMHYGEEWYK